MPERVIRHMRHGAGIKELAHYLGVSRQTIYNWADPANKQYHRAFHQALDLGRELCEAWWMRFGRLAMMQKVPAAPPSWWIFQMKNRFGWRDRVEIAGSDDAPLQIVQKQYVVDVPEGSNVVPIRKTDDG
jgi:predicted DNA-binding transcriptional regulator AlpA